MTLHNVETSSILSAPIGKSSTKTGQGQLELLGAGSGITSEAVASGTQQMWEWIKAGKLQADIEQVPLKDVESAWKSIGVYSKRTVIVP